MPAHRKSIIQEAMERLDALMAIGESRGSAKAAARAAGEKTWGFTTGKIHSFKTRSVYQEQVLAFINWSRDVHQVKRLEDLDQRAEELSIIFLQQQLADKKSPYTLLTIRSALRLFFANRTLGASVPIPKRTRTTITRSRGLKAHDAHFQPANWQPLIRFLQATGLRRDELKCFKYAHICAERTSVSVLVPSGKGGKSRTVPVLPAYEQEVRSLQGKGSPEERVFPRVPKHLDVHACRRAYAQALYLHYAPGWTLPPATGKLRPGDYHREAAQRVTWALGHNRIDVVLQHYLR